jgi:threonyl-tRNA synthetase
MGDKKSWDKAEVELKQILKDSGKEYTILEGDGAFYGPKIDIMMKDSLGREWQMGTIQLDFQIPKKFGLKYTDKNGQEKTPVVIHRVIYGSLERFMGILIEHTGGAFPVWLSPVQAIVISITEKQNVYGREVLEKLEQVGVRAKLDDRGETTSAKIRDAELQKIPYLLIVGDKEIQADSVNVRQRGEKVLGLVKTEDFLKKIKDDIDKKSQF